MSARQSRAGLQPAGEAAIALPKMQVLVCDDSPGVLKLLVLMLNSIGLREIRAGNGKEALAMAKAFRPDLIISDINMPEMNGIELAQTIREDSQLADIPCVLMSSSDWEEKALQVANYFLAKPFTLISVEQIVKSALYRTD